VAVFELQNPGEISERLNLTEGQAIAQYTERREPHDANFEEARPKVEDRYRAERARELAAERARQLCQAKTPEALKAAADSMKLKTDERPGLTGDASICPLITESNLAVVHKLNVGEVTREPIKVTDADNYVVAAMVSRQDADMVVEYPKSKKSIEEGLLQGRRESFFSAYVASVEKRLKAEGKIKIYQDLIDSAMDVVPGAGAQQAMPRAPGFPGAGGGPRRRRTPPAPQ